MAGLLSFLSDINVKAGGQPTGPLASLGGTDYGIDTYRYPIDLGSSNSNHYVLINVLQQRNTQFPGRVMGQVGAIDGSLGASATLKNFGNAAEFIGGKVKELSNAASPLVKLITPNNLSETDAAKFAVGVGSQALDTAGEFIAALKTNNNVRATTSIATTLALYMPDTLNFDLRQSYDSPAMGGELLTMLGAGGGSAVDAFKDANLTPEQKGKLLMKNLSPFVASYLSQGLGNFGKIAFAAATGVVQNPMMELVYSSPSFQTFRFDFMFYPRSQAEAQEVQNIIKRLKFHQAPEALPTTNGYFMIPPSEFSIGFYYNGNVNPNLPKLGICVLESLTVNYTPSGFSAYEVPDSNGGPTKPERGGTGMPVAIQLSLQFKETEMRTKQSYENEYELRTPEEIQQSNSLKDFYG
jgi:hypothetical protein